MIELESVFARMIIFKRVEKTFLSIKDRKKRIVCKSNPISQFGIKSQVSFRDDPMGGLESGTYC